MFSSIRRAYELSRQSPLPSRLRYSLAVLLVCGLNRFIEGSRCDPQINPLLPIELLVNMRPTEELWILMDSERYRGAE